MLKKINLIILIMFAIVLSGCDKKAAEKAAEMNPNFHNLPVEEQKELIAQVQAEQDDADEEDSSSGGQSNAASKVGPANASIFREATKAMGESSAAGPGGGSVSCAWMVNKVLKRSLGITVDGNATALMNKDFKSMVAAGKAEQISVSNAKPGDIIISPTEGKNIGHVGIVGEGGTILSNGGSKGPNGGKEYKWQDKFNMSSWKGYYQTKKGLDMKIFRIV
ncbi:MAG: CHAP domain-containing protein [Candidatus Cloacimonetes bacterium]|nr:CHAP domain-containing protein [Candidatus Cloacimonadota bacterium]